jgi:hypothetical protein
MSKFLKIFNKDEDEDLFMVWLNKNITVHFSSGSILEGILRNYSKETILIETPDASAVVFLGEVQYISSKPLNSSQSGRNELS